MYLLRIFLKVEKVLVTSQFTLKKRSSTKVPLETHFNVVEPGGKDHNKLETMQSDRLTTF